MLFGPLPPEPVSYYREVAPIFAMHCNGCHGDAGGLSLRRFSDVTAGGKLGKAVIPGDPARSLLLHFVEGRRGPARLMPIGGRPLSPEQIETLRRWIAEGAREDASTNRRREVRRLTGVKLRRGEPLRVSCRIPASSYFVITALDPATNAALWQDEGALKSPREQNDAGEPGEWRHWDLRAAPGWPEVVALEIAVAYASGPVAIEFSAR